jgi:glycerol-3-phosphate dehydrogenase
LGEPLSPKFGYTAAEVVWAVREEMALTLDDVLARRVRMLFVDAREAKRVARRVAELMAEELERDEQWIDTQVSEFEALADRYVYQPK